MSRKSLISNNRSFRRNPRSFIDKITKQPFVVDIDDGVNPPYQIKISTVLGQVTEATDVPDSVKVVVSRERDPETLEDL